MKFSKQKLQDGKYVYDSLIGEKHRLTKTYFYQHYYETDEYWLVAYKMMLTSGLEFMIVRKSDMIIIKQSIQDHLKAKKLIKILEENI